MIKLGKWLKILNNGCDLFIQIFNTSNSKRIKDPLWMNKEIKQMCRRKRKLWIQCIIPVISVLRNYQIGDQISLCFIIFYLLRKTN